MLLIYSIPSLRKCRSSYGASDSPKALELVDELLDFMKLCGVLNDISTTSREMLEGIIELGDGEKDPRCLLLFLRLHSYVPYFEKVLLESQSMQQKGFTLMPATFQLLLSLPQMTRTGSREKPWRKVLRKPSLERGPYFRRAFLSSCSKFKTLKLLQLKCKL